MYLIRIYKLLPLAFLAIGLSLTGCDSSSSEDDSPSIGGMYVGSETENSVTAMIALEIPNTDSGTFTFGNESEISIEDNGVTFSFNVDGGGTYDHPDLTMNVELTANDITESEQWTGTVSASGDILSLSVEGSEFTLTRE